MNGQIKNEWFATKPEEFEIMYEAGINRVKQREVNCNQREIDCNKREKKLNEKDMDNDKNNDDNDDDSDSGNDSDVKIKSKPNPENKDDNKSKRELTKSNNVATTDNNLKKRKGNEEIEFEQSKSNKKTDSPLVNDNNVMSDNEEDYWNSTVKVIETETFIQFSPGQITVSNDSLLDDYTIGSPGTFF
jgi:hypothetical protein